MPDILTYDFMVRAFIAGILIALVIPVLGSFLVARRYSLIADSLAHVSLAGVGAGLLLGFAPVVIALPVTIVGALFLEWLRQRKALSGEVGLAILMSGGLAAAVVLANMANGANVDFTSYLFGSITTTTTNDVLLLAGIAAGILIAIGHAYRAFVYMAFDEDSARIAGHKTRFLNYLLVAMTAAMVVSGLRIVGGLLISALLVIPVVAASRVSNSFSRSIILAVIFALIAVIGGLLLAFYAGVAAGGAIVLTALAILFLTFVWKS